MKAEVGKPLELHLTSDDVVHGFAVGQMDMESVDVLPGKVTDLTLTFNKPGSYTFYCTRWCGLNHWRMRGTIHLDGFALPQWHRFRFPFAIILSVGSGLAGIKRSSGRVWAVAGLVLTALPVAAFISMVNVGG